MEKASNGAVKKTQRKKRTKNTFGNAEHFAKGNHYIYCNKIPEGFALNPSGLFACVGQNLVFGHSVWDKKCFLLTKY